MKQKRFSTAFTIVELLIVIVIIAILATLTAIGVGAWRQSIAETEVKSNLHNAQAGMDDVRNFNNNYPIFPINTEFNGAEPSVVATNNIAITAKDVVTASEKVRLRYVSGTGSTYCISAESVDRPAVRWRVRSGGVPEAGIC